MNNFGEYIYKLRKKSKKTVKKITGQLQITPQYLNDLENNKRVPSSELLKRINDIYDLKDNDSKMLYDLAAKSYKSERVPIDIAEFIIENSNAKNEIRDLMKKYEK